MSRPVALPSAVGGLHVLRRVETYALTGLVSIAVFWLAFDGGSFDLSSRHTVAVAAWWTVLVAVVAGLWPRARIFFPAAAVAALFLAFALFSLASSAWADSAEKAVLEFDRVLLYLGVFLVVVFTTRPGSAERIADGLAIAIGATALVALATRCFPDVFGTDQALAFLPSAQNRLSFPLDYWNGLAILTALGFPLFLRVALSAGGMLRGAAIAPLPGMAGVIYLTSSRGGVGTAVIGTVLFVALSPRRREALGAAALAALGSAATILVLHVRPELVNHPGTEAAETQGASAAALIIAICVLTGLAHFAAGRYLRGRLRIKPLAERIALGVAALALIAGLIALDPIQQFRDFKAPPPSLQTPQAPGENPTQEHLLSASGTGRWQQWTAAVDAFETRPLVGRGAGSYEAWWAQHGSISGYVRDGHSLYLETLGELGIVGFSLLAGIFLVGIATGVRRWRRASDGRRLTLAALLALFVGYTVVAGIDWMWETTVVSVVAIIALGLLTGPATDVERRERPLRRRRNGRRRLAVAGAVVLACGLVLASEAAPLLADAELSQSREATERRDGDAAENAALAARSLTPWAATPHLQLALVEEMRGDVPRARLWLGEAIERDDSDWRLWLVSARLATKAGDIGAAREALRRAAELNPRSPLFAGFKHP